MSLHVIPPAGLSFRMTMQDYQRMEKELPNARVTREDTAEVAGYKLGVQLVLQYVRDTFLVI